MITDAVASQKWPGEAKVHVSLVNWVMDPAEPPKPFTIDGVDVEGIGPDLRETAVDAWTPVPLPANRGRAFAGVVPQGRGFVLDDAKAARLLARGEAVYAKVVKPFLVGQDIMQSPQQKPSRWIVDFREMSLEEARRYPAAAELVMATVKEEREHSVNAAKESRWWLHGVRVPGMRNAIDRLPRYIAGPGTAKRLMFAWQEPGVLPSNASYAFAFSDDFSMGVIASRMHGAWAWARSSTLKGDLRYTNTSVFMTFPWPDTATAEQRERVADASRRLLARRSEICLGEQIGLTTLYNAVDEGAYTDLKGLHRELDEAVAECYGWPKAVAQDDRELVRRLTELNRLFAFEGEAVSH